MEKLYYKNQLLPKLKELYEEAFKESFENNGISVSFGSEALSFIYLHKRAEVGVLVGLLRNHCNSLQETAESLLELADKDYMDYDQSTGKFIVKYEISKEVERELELFQFPLPMVIKPLEVKANSDIGFLTSKGSLLLNNQYHEEDICLDHINRVNKIRLRLNLDTVQSSKNTWKSLDKPKKGESRIDFLKRRAAFEKYKACVDDVVELVTQEGNEFWFTHGVDKRGRAYCVGYHLNYQGHEWNKGVIEFVKEELPEGE